MLTKSPLIASIILHQKMISVICIRRLIKLMKNKINKLISLIFQFALLKIHKNDKKNYQEIIIFNYINLIKI